MRRPCVRVYVHYVWATWDRVPFLVPELEHLVYREILAKCTELKSPVEAIGGTENHVHLLVQQHSATSIAQVAKEVKGASSHLVTHNPGYPSPFKWQGSYGAFSVSAEHVPRAVSYIRLQKQRHDSAGIIEAWDRTDELMDE